MVLSSASVHNSSAEGHHSDGRFQCAVAVQDRWHSSAGSVLEKDIDHGRRTTYQNQPLQVNINKYVLMI